MNQVSRPMQIALAAVLVFSLAWFAVLRPKDPAEDVAATPVTAPATTPNAEPGGAAATTNTGKIIETAKTGAAEADAAVKSRESETGAGESAAKATPTATAKADTPAATTPAGTTPDAKAGKAELAKSTAKGAQAQADKVISKISADLAKQRAVVVLVWSKDGREDKIVHARIKKNINRRGGRVRTYYVPVSQVGRYDGLLRGLSIGQIPSTIVIAPDNQAKVLGGLVSTARIDRLTSSATLTKPADDGKKK